MESRWENCKNLLCIRADNMGDLIMTGPALRALKETLHCRITLLTSSMGAPITAYLPWVDETMVADLPWVKTSTTVTGPEIDALVKRIKEKQFDGAVIFTVYSQTALPSAMLAFMAGIPLRLAYSRENPYHLLTHWVSDPEPYVLIRHQVERDLHLLKSIEVFARTSKLELLRSGKQLRDILSQKNIQLKNDWMVLHPGVSEEKRTYPKSHWIALGRQLIAQTGMQLMITGSASEKELSAEIAAGIGDGAVPLAGLLDMEGFIAVISEAPLVITVNTATAHVAAAFDIPVLVLYALTNPQHTPWTQYSQVLYFSVPARLESKNEIVRYVAAEYMDKNLPFPTPSEVVEKALSMLDEYDIHRYNAVPLPTDRTSLVG
jgi:ADP-heptose:LPS heptosyltransferase